MICQINVKYEYILYSILIVIAYKKKKHRSIDFDNDFANVYKSIYSISRLIVCTRYFMLLKNVVFAS